ncbi:MAG TPA: hypothetical protein VFZ61_23040 [Polyangiales bacterium]
MLRHRHFIAVGSALWLTACSVELSSQGDVVGIEDAAPSGVVISGGGPANPEQPAGVGGGDPAVGAGGIGALADAGGAQPDAAAAGPDAAAALPEDAGAGAVPTLPFTLVSPDFAAGSTIPDLHTCKGGDQSPAFVWQGAPVGTASFALLLTTHTTFLATNVDYQRWVMWNIPATRSALPAAIEEGHTPSDVPGAIQASNESENLGGNPGGNPGGWAGGNVGGGFTGGGPGGNFGGGSGDARQGRRYRGPCSYGFPQTFEFVLYALGDTPEPPAWRFGITPDEIVDWLTMEATVLGSARLEGVAP